MSRIKAEITYPKRRQTFRAECLRGHVTVQKAHDYQIEGREIIEILVDITNTRPGPNKSIKLSFEEKTLSKIIEAVETLEEIEPEDSFSSREKTYKLYPRDSGISFALKLE